MLFKVIEIGPEEILAESREGEIRRIKRNKVYTRVRESHWLVHVEHGFYDIVDENGDRINFVGTE